MRRRRRQLWFLFSSLGQRDREEVFKKARVMQSACELFLKKETQKIVFLRDETKMSTLEATHSQRVGLGV